MILVPHRSMFINAWHINKLYIRTKRALMFIIIFFIYTTLNVMLDYVTFEYL